MNTAESLTPYLISHLEPASYFSGPQNSKADALIGDPVVSLSGNEKRSKAGIDLDISYEPIDEGWIHGSAGLYPNSFRKITELTISSGSNKLDIFGLIPQGWQTFFSVDEVNYGCNSYDSSKHIEVSGYPINSLEGILTLLHEIGHARLNNFAEERISRANFLTSGDFYEEDAEKILRSERNAWAFALEQLRPFLREGALSKEDALELIHAGSLKDYSDAMIKRMYSTLVAA